MGCQNERHIQDLQSLQSAINTLEKGLIDGTVDVESAQIEADQLVVAYKELTKQEIVSSMQSFIFSLEEEKQKLQRLWTLPIWAEKLWLSLPHGMKLQKNLSHQVQAWTTWQDSLLLVYKGPYDNALQEAQRIASGAKLFLSPEIAQAQAMLKSWNTLSGFATQELMDAIVYTNHRLLDSNIDTLISVSVAKEWLLTLEATNYKK